MLTSIISSIGLVVCALAVCIVDRGIYHAHIIVTVHLSELSYLNTKSTQPMSAEGAHEMRTSHRSGNILLKGSITNPPDCL